MTYLRDEEDQEGVDILGGGWRVVDGLVLGVRVSDTNRF